VGSMNYVDADTVVITVTVSAYEYATPYTFYKLSFLNVVSRWKVTLIGRKHPNILGG
jgi:hypothetical protein